MFKKMITKDSLFYLFMSLLFAVSLSYQVQLLLDIQEVQILNHLLYMIGALLILFALSRFPRVAMGIVIVGGLSIIGNWYFDLQLIKLEDIDFLYQPVRWAITLNDEKGAMPPDFYPVFGSIIGMASFGVYYLIRKPFISLALLTTPLFFIGSRPLETPWFIFYLFGLVSIIAILHKKKPSLLVMSLVILLVVGVSPLLSSRDFFNVEFSRWVNDFSPNRWGTKDEFSLGQVGFSASDTRIGGPVKLTNEPFMEVLGPPNSFYLRGSVFDSFEDNVWYRSAMNETEVFLNDNPTDFQAEVFNYFEKEQNSSLFTVMNIQIHPINRTFRTVFTAGTPRQMGLEEDGYFFENTDNFHFNKHGQITSDQRITGNNGVSIIDYVVPTRNANLQALTVSRRQVRRVEAQGQYGEMVLEHDPILYDLVYNQLANTENPLLLMQAIINHFDNNYLYSINVDNVPFDESVIEWFFENKVGYCVYYGSAMTLLLQDVGYDARYVEGFVVPQAQPDDFDQGLNPVSRTVTTNTAHARTEIYIEGLGWYPIDATTSRHLIELENGNPQGHLPDEPVEPDLDEEPTPPVDPTDPTNPDETPDEPTPPSENRIAEVIQVLVIASAFLAIGFWRFDMVNKRHSRDYLIQHFKGREKDLVTYLWHDLLNLSDRPIVASESIFETMHRITKDKRMSNVAEMSEIVSRTIYSHHLPTGEEARKFLDFTNALSAKMEAKLSISSRIYHYWVTTCRWVNR